MKHSPVLSAHEAEAVKRANGRDGPVVVFIHGLWLLPSSWERWAEHFEERGFTAVDPGWPADPDTAAEANAPPEVMDGKSITEVANHFAMVIQQIDRRPAVI